MPPYQFGNAANDFYLRQAQALSANQPQFQQYQQTPQPLRFPAPQQAQPQIAVSIVTNIEEANATKVDPFTSHVFIDTTNGKIYFKQMDEKFQSKFTVFTQEQIQAAVPVADPVDEIKQRLTNIENILGGIANAKSVSDVAGYEKPAVDDTAADVEENAGSKPSAFSRGNGSPKWKK